jgi:outer membrane protein TolC
MTKTLLRAATGPVVCALLLSAGCNWYRQEPIPFDPRTLQQSQRTAAEGQVSETKRPLPTTLESPFVQPAGTGANNRNRAQATTLPTAAPTTGPALSEDPVIRMPLQEVMQRAVANNLDVRVAGYGPAIESTRVVEAEARYDPTFFVNSQYQSNDRDQAAQFTSTDEADVWTTQVGIRQNLPSGGQAELRNDFVRTRDRNDNSFFNPNPFYTSDLVLQVTQPILRDFGNEINRARILISRNNQRISLLDFRQQLEESAADIEQTYWQLVQAERDVRINERLLDETLRTAEVLWRRRGQDVTRVQLSQANASVEERRALLIGNKARVRDLSDRLKRLMNDPDLPVASATLILPGNPPVEEPVRFDLGDQINTALEHRLELGQQQLRVDSARIAADVAKNNLLPQLNIVGSVSVNGLDDTANKAFSSELEFENIGWAIGFQFEIPIGNRAARATNQRARLQQQQAITQYANLIEQVALDVRTAMRDVDTRWDQIIATRQSTFAQQDALLAIQQREDAGEQLTPTFVQLKLDQQERFARAASQEAEAVSNYNNALAVLERAKGTLLRYNNILMEEGPFAGR